MRPTTLSTWTTTSIFCVLLACCSATALFAQSAAEPSIDTSRFRLYRDQDTFRLLDRRSAQWYAMPEKMLIPPISSDETDDLEALVAYDSVVTGFSMGGTLYGLRFCSYAISDGGSLALAEGLDAFAVLDFRQKTVLPDVFHPGITRFRYKMMGYPNARYTRFYLGYLPESAWPVLGAATESITAGWSDENSRIDGPFYEMGPLEWYLFDGTRWRHHPELQKRLAARQTELPLTGLIMTPIDWAKARFDRR